MWTVEWGFQLFTRVETESQVGWGQSLPSSGNFSAPYLSLIQRISPAIIGENEEDVKKLWKKMFRLLFTGGYGITTSSISSIDIALWDIISRKRGLNLSEVLGGEKKAIKRYASLARYRRESDLTNIVRNLVDEGFKLVKLHQEAGRTLSAMKAIRESIGYSADIAIDLNSSLDLDSTVNFFNQIIRYEPKWIEEPLWPPDDYKSLRKLNQIAPVACGENVFSYFEFERLVESDSVSYLQPDVSKVGGITAALDIFHMLSKNKIGLMPHCRPDNGWLTAVVTAEILGALGIDSIVETPPNSIPTEYLKFEGSINSLEIHPTGTGIGLEPISPFPIQEVPPPLNF